MYDSLTTMELTLLQDMLFGAVETAYRILSFKDCSLARFAHYHPMHRELGYLFIEVGEALIARLDQGVKAA
jgi:hypothetical protein